MQRLQHPHIIRLEGVYEDRQTLMLVLEYARGTELFDAILQKKRYPEAEARPIFEQVARALAYLHSLNIVHRCALRFGGVGDGRWDGDGVAMMGALLANHTHIHNIPHKSPHPPE